MWFKKKAYISGYNSNTAVGGYDWRTVDISGSWPASQTLPSAADANKYFYLPCLGCYSSGQLKGVSSDEGYYWSSSAYALGSNYAFGLTFTTSSVHVNYIQRNFGFRVDGGFE